MEKNKGLLIAGIGCGALLLLSVCAVVVVMFVLIPMAKKSSSDGDATAIEKIVNTVGYVGVKELKNEEDQKKIWEDAMKNMSEQDEFQMSRSMEESGRKVDMTVKVKGDDMEMNMSTETDGTSYSMTIVTIGEYLYYGVNGNGVKMLKNTDTSEEMTSEWDTDELKESLGDSEWDAENIEYKGIDTIDNKKLYKFYNKSDESTIWIDGLTILPVKAESGENGDITITYSDIEINEPEGYEDISSLSEDEQGMKLFEILMGSMEDYEYNDYSDESYDEEGEW